MRTLNDIFIPFEIPAIGGAAQKAIPVPDGGRVIKIITALNVILTVADCILTFKNAAAASMGTLTVAFTGSAVGDVDTLEPTANNEVLEGEFIEVETDGGGTAGGPISGVIVVRR